MQKIVILNPKGGSGKTTIATNLASYFAVEGLRPTLMDMDAQGSSTHWLSKRAKDQPLIHGIAGFERNTGVTRSFATRLPLDTQRLVVDTPAAVEPQKLPDLTRNATAVLVPVLPSDIDIHAAAKCISNLLLIAKIGREEQRIAVIANRVKKQTLVYKSLMKFLENLQIPVIATLARFAGLHSLGGNRQRHFRDESPTWCGKTWSSGCRWWAGWRSVRRCTSSRVRRRSRRR